MTIWQEFENQCVEHFNKRFSRYAHFILQGGTNSTIPDILVKSMSGKSFYIEAKHSPAQCGQFVLLPHLDTCTFEYSKLNVNRINRYAETIIDYMNRNFDVFHTAGTTGKKIDIPNASNIFADWIIHTYRDKGTNFFVTNNFTLLPLESFKDYFDVTAKYRIKRSGSSSVGKSKIELILNHIISKEYLITSHRINGNKLFVSSPNNLDEQRFIIRGMEYMFSLRGNEYELRKLSNTYNANVIFSIKQKEDIPPGMTDDEFIEYLR